MPSVFMFMRRLAAVTLVLLAAALGPALPAIAGQTLYTSTLSNLETAQKGGTVIASISPGVALDVIKTSGDRLKVAIVGWSPQGGEKYLFTKMGQRIRLADITDQGLASRSVVSQQKDYYENVWDEVRLSGWIDKNNTTADIVDVWQSARTLFQKRCTRCHALHRPTEFKANQWPSILKIMMVRAGLSSANKALVTQYLQTYAKDQTGAPALVAQDSQTAPPDPTIAKITGDSALASKGAALFAQYGCAACHGDDANTPALPAYPRLAGQNADYLYKQLEDFKTGARGNDPDNMMKDTIADINDADLRAMSYWLSSTP